MKLAKTYQASEYESDIYKLWESAGSFKPTESKNGKSYAIVMPPPNANAGLHIGYALTAALEDISARHKRMKGYSTLLLPGADHAGFETQVVYEKHLAKEGKSRFDFTRDELYDQIWDFVQKNKGLFEEQIRIFGASADWSKFTFTLDEKIIKKAHGTFKKMWDEGLVYRGERLVNYCTFHGTGFADIEVIHKKKNGSIWTLEYPLSDGSGSINVATTRPETMLGDVAVAVHPEDTRYKSYVGKTVTLPLTDREVPIIADDFVDKDFGTGAVKITPAHDHNDYEAGERNDLPKLTVIGLDGKINQNAPQKYQGLTVLEARKKIVEDIDNLGLLNEVNDHENNVGHCYKCDTIIEPLLLKQWFINMKPLAAKAIKALKEKKITFYPDSKRSQLIKYLEGLRDWNISRQIAWGIPIPAFVNVEDDKDWIYDERVNHETLEINNKIYRRDSDVFDTWFSSSSWPYATIDYPENDDLKQFYPNGLMETGGEILYPWVSRMIMLGLYNFGEIPFKEVYIHGYVMAEDGAKMSKSLGNVVDPIPVIKEYGSDAMRMGIISGRSAAVNTGYDQRRVVEARNFCNKIWNIARYIESQTKTAEMRGELSPVTPADHWILSRLNESSKKIDSLLDKYEFAEAYETVYHLIWDDVADWYIESSKKSSNIEMLHWVLESCLKLVHPFAPFLSETIWQTLYPKSDTLLISQDWPGQVDFQQSKAEEFEQVKTIVKEIRQIKTVLKIQKGTLVYIDSKIIKQNSELIKSLAKLDCVDESKEGSGIKLSQIQDSTWLDVSEDSAKEFMNSLENREKELSSSIKNLEGRLKNKNYVDKAPKKLVDETKEQLEQNKAEQQTLLEQIKSYKN